MAERHTRYGSEVWWPDRCNVGQRLMLDPKLTPMENCWRVIRAQVSIWLTKAKIWAYRKEDIEDIELECQMRVFEKLKQKVRTNEYDRNWSFWHNVRACAWSVVSNVIRSWLILQREKLNNVYCTRNNEDMFHNMASHSVLKPCSSSEYAAANRIKHRPHRKLEDAVSALGAKNILRRMIRHAYNEYVEDCEEYSLKAMDINDFAQKNFGDEIAYYTQMYGNANFSNASNEKKPSGRPKLCPYLPGSREAHHWYYLRRKEKINKEAK